MEAFRRDGYIIVRNFMSHDITRRLRALIDEVAGPPAKSAEAHLAAKYGGLNCEPNGAAITDQRYLPGMVRSRSGQPPPPVVSSKNWRHELRHPFHDTELMAAALEPVVDVHQQLHGMNDCKHLKLMQQLLVRTDPLPEQEAAVHRGPQGWHLDNAYLPSYREPMPNYPHGQVHYHAMVALNDIRPGGAALCVVPQSHRTNMQDMAELSAGDRAVYEEGGKGRVFRDKLLQRHLVPGLARRAVDGGIEVLMNEGDLVAFDTMLIHSDSPCSNGETRYVYFTTCITDMALRDPLGATLFPPRQGNTGGGSKQRLHS